MIDADGLSGEVLRKITEFLDSQDTSHPFQFPQWLGLNVAGSPRGVRFALLWEGDQLRWFARCGTSYPMGVRVSPLRVIQATRGPVCDDISVWSEPLHTLVEQSNAEAFAYVGIAPERVASRGEALLELLRRDGWESSSGVRVSLRLDVSRDEDRILAGFRKSTRYEVNRAERAGISVESAQTDAEVSGFLKMHDEMGERKGFAVEAEEHVRNSCAWFLAEPERGVLLVARRQGQLLGGVVIVRAGKRCWYVWGATQKHEGFSVGHRLQWKAILWAKAHGCAEYDFGGYREGATSGPALFKQGFGGDVVTFVPAYRKVARVSRNRVLQAFAKFRG